MATDPYDELLQLVRQLPEADRTRLLRDITAQNKHEKAESTKSNIWMLRGLGKELWQGIDAQKYVNEERASWTD